MVRIWEPTSTMKESAYQRIEGATLIIDPSGRVIDANAAWADMVKRNQEELSTLGEDLELRIGIREVLNRDIPKFRKQVRLETTGEPYMIHIVPIHDMDHTISGALIELELISKAAVS